MTDLQIALIAAACSVVPRRVRRPVRPAPPVNVLELVTGLATALVFVYLFWALLRPEDF